MNKIMLDTRMKNKIEHIQEIENCCSVKFIDLPDTFWFNEVSELQEFLNIIARERYYDKKLRKGYFMYTNENNEVFKYTIESKRGTLKLISEDYVETIED